MIKTDEICLNRIGFVILYVKDPLKSLAFYCETLGMTVRSQTKRWVELESSGVVLALHAHEDMPSTRSEAAPEVVFEVEDIHETYALLKERGVKFTTELRQVHQGVGVVGLAGQFSDPDRNRLSIYGTVATSHRPV